MSTANVTRATEPIGLLDFGECTRVPSDAFSVPIAWPVSAWRTLIPSPRRTGSDPLLRAVLRIVGAGCVDPNAIALWLDLPADLVRTLLTMYRTEGYLRSDERLNLTESGRKLLDLEDEITFSDRSHRTAWILRDDWSGDIIPFLLEDDLRWVGRDARASFSVLAGERRCNDRPQAISIREALAQYRRYARYVRECERTNDSAALSSEVKESEPAIVQAAENPIPGIVQLLWERSETVYVPGWLYVTADDPSIWQLATGLPCPPVDHWLASKLGWAAGRIPDLQSQLNDWVVQARSLFPARPTLNETDSRAILEFPYLASCPELSDTRQLLARAYRAGALYELNPENIDVYLTRCYLALEALLTACLGRCCDAVAATNFVRDDSFVDQLREVAGRLDVELPRGFCNPQYAKKTRRAASGRGENLRDRATAVLYCAMYDRTSAARAAFRADREILVHIDTVTTYRNRRGSHYEPSAGLGNEPAMATQVERSTRQVVAVLGASFFGDQQQ